MFRIKGKSLNIGLALRNVPITWKHHIKHADFILGNIDILLQCYDVLKIF